MNEVTAIRQTVHSGQLTTMARCAECGKFVQCTQAVPPDLAVAARIMPVIALTVELPGLTIVCDACYWEDEE